MSSYYLKTAALLEIKKDESKWSDEQLAEKLKEMLKCLQEYFKNRFIPSLHDSRLNLLHHIDPVTLFNAERRLNRFIGTDETVQIHDKLMDVLNKSSKLQYTKTFTALMVQGKVCSGNEVEIEWKRSNAGVEDLLEKAFPFERKENEINVNNSDYNWCILV